MASIKPSSRYATANFSFESRSSTRSDPSSSTEVAPKSQFLRPSSRDSSRAIVPTKAPSKDNANFSSMVKKLVDHRSSSAPAKKKGEYKLAIPADFIAEDLKKTARKGTTGLTSLHKKLFKGSAKRAEGGEPKALTEFKGNTRTLAMVLRSERELLSMNQEQENQITELKLLLEEKNKEVDKLKDLCLKQREEIKSLKSVVLFPDVMNSQLQELMEKQTSELKQARQLIPNLQRQVTSLTDQLQYLAEDFAEVKADKYSMRGFYDSCISSPRTPEYDHREAANSLDFSSEDNATPESPDDMFLKDLNPCLTPYDKTKSKEFDTFDVPDDQDLHSTISFSSCARKLSKSSDCCQCSKSGNK
ncbi:PREDICTED: uncharacterized protein LOC109185548 [Ipomoea nil]|uniref:uncharacterized protein LOC109185548 n=1 Tax=Ipomoea nil TaxID=35883 RepID=UPI000901D0B4|nr:PREDICTED: uncharacterized protein LOC109185548 [Ipomoea nil]